jgi:hypothetical protein
MNKERIVIDFAYLTMCAENDYIYETGEAKALLDYITNLQQENEELKRNCNIGNENLSFYRNENKELHNKIDKAIEYIKNKQVIDLDYLEEILKDSDVDVKDKR